MIRINPTIVTTQFKPESLNFPCTTIPCSVVMNVEHQLNGLQVLWTPPPGAQTAYPCVDCGLMTGNFCDGGITVAYDHCFASERVPADYLDNEGQRTPLCSYCETLSQFCRFCRRVHSCTPPNRHRHWSGVPQSQSRQFSSAAAAFARARQSQSQSRAQSQTSTTPRSQTSTEREAALIGQQRQDEDDQRIAGLLEDGTKFSKRSAQ